MRAAVALALALTALPAWSQPAPEAPDPSGEPVPATPVRDADFGVSTRRPGLQRQVEMYQWRRTSDGYVREWSIGRVDSDSYDPAHRNPGALPLASRTWWARDAVLDGRPVDDAVLRALGQWRTFRPGFNRLPANMAATFQPEGDGLSSAENPLQPEIGDLRITWKALHLPPLEGRIDLRDGRWVLASEPAEAGATAMPAAARPLRASEDDRGGRSRWPLFAGLGAVALAIAAAVRRRRRRRATTG